jgi:integrase
METIGYYADMLYVSHAWWREKSREKFREYTDKTFLNRSRLVKNYIIPIWGVYKPEELTPQKINDPLKNIVGVISKMPLSGWTKNQVLRCLSNIYIYLIEEDIIDKNPVGSVMRFSCRQSKKRGAIPIPQMATLFPENHEELLRIWRTQRYICAFLVLRDTGLRPGELVALKWSDWYPEKRFFPILRAIESGTKNREKETKTGMAKPAIVTELT